MEVWACSWSTCMRQDTVHFKQPLLGFQTTPFQTTPANLQLAASAGSSADVPVKQEPAETEQGSRSALPSPSAAAAETPSGGTVTAAPEPSPGAEPSAPAADEAKTETTEAPATGEAALAPVADSEQTQPPAETADGAAGDQPSAQQQQQQESVPQLVKVVHSARSVFRQRDFKEYDPFTAHLERRITKLFEVTGARRYSAFDIHLG